MQLNKSVRLYFLISAWKNIWLTCSHRVEPCVVCFQIFYLDWWIVAMKCIFSPLCASKCVFRCTGWLATECFVALYTFVVLLSAVNDQVPLQIYNFTEWFAAIWAKMHLYPTVCQQVSLQMSSKSEWFVAFSTFVWLLPAVNEHVSLQIYSLTEWFVAFWAYLCNFSPMWVNIWLASWLEYLNDLTHILQGCEFAMSKIWSVLLPLLVDNDCGKFVCPHSLYDLSVH